MRDLIERLTPRYKLGAPAFQRPDLTFVDLAAQRPAARLLLELRDREGFTHLVLLTAVDWLEEGRFQLTYLLNNRTANRTLGLRVYPRPRRAPSARRSTTSGRPPRPTSASCKEMFGIDFPGCPRVDEEFILEGWTDMPPYRRDFDTLAYSQQTYRRPPRAAPRPTRART